MEVLMPDAGQRRLLVELLANELAGDTSVRVVGLERETALGEIVALGLAVRSPGCATLTHAGRTLAQRLADHMLGLQPRLEGCA